MNIDSFLKKQGVQFRVVRNNVAIAEVIGLYNHEQATSKKYIEFKPDTDIQPNDCLINPAKEKSYVTDVQTSFFAGNPFSLKAFYESETEHNAGSANQSVIFNINNATGSVIGNHNILNVSYSNQLQELKKAVESADEPDKKELSEIVSLLELIVENRLPVKKGLLSNFSDIIAKHSWLASQLTALLISWLTSQ